MIISRRNALKLASSGLVLASASASAASQATGPYKAAIGLLKTYLDRHLAAYSLPGITVALADGNGFSTTLTAGWADVERKRPVTAAHYFQIGSISKSLCSLAILKLVDEGKLSLDTQIWTLLPEFPIEGPPVTVRHLLTHSSGLASDPPLAPHSGKLWQGFTPGSQFSYSNTGFQMLGLIVAKLRGKPYAAALAEDVLGPLGMTEARPAILSADRDKEAVGYSPYFPDRTYPRGGRLGFGPWGTMTEASGCVAATAGAMAIYIKWLIDSASGKGTPLISAASRKMFGAPAIESAEFGPGAHYALGLAILAIDDRPVLYHTGGMLIFSSAIMVDEEAGVGAFASVNARAEESYRPRGVTAYAIRLMRAVKEGKPLPPLPEIRTATKVDGQESFIGTFRSSDGKVIELVPFGDGRGLRYNGQTLPLQTEGDSFTVVGPGDATSSIKLDLAGGGIRSVGWKDTLYGEATSAKLPEAQRLYAGLYDGGNPWIGMMEIVARPDGLWLGGTTPLVPLEDGSFRVGTDEWSPERVRFDSEIDGVPQRMLFSGVDLLRV
jgi:CubicO group peptidase (beta-lactamase class C family)